MLTLVTEKQSVTDSLVACSEVVLEFQRHRTDLADVRTELPAAESRWRNNHYAVALPNTEGIASLQVSGGPSVPLNEKPLSRLRSTALRGG